MFVHPIMLIGIAAAVLPLVLHLLSRARYKDVEWGAMMFLENLDGQRRQSARFSQILLLIIRSAMIAFLAVALARPIAQGRWAGIHTPGRVTAALLLDCSASMGFDENGRTRFQMAQATARQIIRGLRPGDRVLLIQMGVPNSPADLEPTGDLRAIEAKIDDAKVGSGTANVANSLNMAAEVLGRFEKSSRDVYVVCDRLALSWQSIDDEKSTVAWQTLKHDPGTNTRMFVLPVGNTDADNVAVDSAKLLNPPVIVGQPANFEVVVHNYGPVQHAAVPLDLEGSNIPVSEKSISLAPRDKVTVQFTVTFGTTGSQILTAKIKSAGFTSDDQFDLAVNVLPPIRVLIVSGDETQGQFRSESDYLKWAMAPYHSAGLSGNDPCDVTVVPAEGWSESDLPGYQVVVLANVERFTPQQAHSLEKYVYSGGRLLIAPGNLTRVEDYNAQLYRDGAGILPAMLETPTATDGSEATSLLGFESPVFHRFPIPSATIVRYFPVIPRQGDTPILASYLNNAPFLIEGKSERGRVLLTTTALDADWSTLPLSNFYLPFVQSAIRYLAGDIVVDGNLAPGDSIRKVFEDPAAVRSVSLMRPDNKTIQLDVIRNERRAEVRYSETDEPGQYHLQVEQTGKPSQTIHYVVSPSRAASDLTQLTPERWSSLEHSLGMTRVEATGRPVLETVAANRGGRELWGAALAAVIILAGLEMLVARLSSVQMKHYQPQIGFSAKEDQHPHAQSVAV